MKRFKITKNSVEEIQNLAPNHKSWPIKSNPVKVQKRCDKGACYIISNFIAWVTGLWFLKSNEGVYSTVAITGYKLTKNWWSQKL